MRSAISFGLLLLMIQCGPRRGSRTAEAPGKPGGGPKITKLAITPEQPTPGQEATATVVIRDEKGVKGFRVSLGDKTKDVSCDGEKVCTRTLTRVFPQVSSPTVTLRIVAENMLGRRTRMEREVPLRLKVASAPPAAPRMSAPGAVQAFFRSGFEEGVTLKAPEAEKGNWVQ